MTNEPVRIAFCLEEERGALRLFLRALRRLPLTLPWEAAIWTEEASEVRIGRRLRERVHSVGPREIAPEVVKLLLKGQDGRRTHASPGGLISSFVNNGLIGLGERALNRSLGIVTSRQFRQMWPVREHDPQREC